MTDLDPAIWQNPTLGTASTNPFLDEIEVQAEEDRSAKIEARTPRVAIRISRYPAHDFSGIDTRNSSGEIVALVDTDTFNTLNAGNLVPIDGEDSTFPDDGNVPEGSDDNSPADDSSSDIPNFDGTDSGGNE